VSEQVRWGILGTGKIARILATALADSRDGTLVAIGSRDAERARRFADEFGAPHAADYDAIVEHPDVDLAYVATPHPTHRQWAVAAADAGKHVLCEKPMAMRHQDAAEIVEAARRNDVFLLEAFAYRCHPQTHRLVELLRGGRIGEVRVVDAAFGYDAGPTPGNYLLRRELGGGGILDVGCYTTSMAHLVAASAIGRSAVETLEVGAAGIIGPSGVDHSAAAALVFEGGLLARVACSIQANLEGTLRITGSEGRIDVASPWLPGRIGRKARIVVHRWDEPEPEVIDVPLEADVYAVEVEAVNGFVQKGERSPTVMPWEDSLANMLTLDRWRSAIGLHYETDA
jgi:predicted dehydrogenase